MAVVKFGPALVTSMRGAVSSFVFDWTPPRSTIRGRKRGVRDRKVGRHSVPKLLARLDVAWRALPLIARNALRAKATSARLTNYIWFRRHMLNHQRRLGYPGPIQLNLNTAHYKPILTAGYAPGDITELAWDDPAASEQTLDLTDVDGVDATQVQDAIHCELLPEFEPWSYDWSHGHTPPPMEWYWTGTWTPAGQAGFLNLSAFQDGGSDWFLFSAHIEDGESIFTGYLIGSWPVDWEWGFSPDNGTPDSGSGRDEA